MGLRYQSLGKTTYGYDIDCLKIGYGEKKLFIVGGTHGSEIISVDFVTQLLRTIKELSFFDANKISIVAIPLQNPEGFEVTTKSLRKISKDFNNSSMEYYLRYRMDDIINNIIKDLNIITNDFKLKNAHDLIIELKEYIRINPNFMKIEDKRAIPEIYLFKEKINKIDEYIDFPSLRIKIIAICNELMTYLENKEKIDIHDTFFIEFITIIKEYFNKEELWQNITHNRLKLHQDMFKDVGFSEIKNESLKNNIINLYETYNHVLGSQATFDATGEGINLNANSKNNPGVKEFENGNYNYRLGVRNNLYNHIPGPLGSATKDPKSFTYAKENIALYELLKNAYKEGNYLGTFLYHGTGGMIFYKPHEESMEENLYAQYLNENLEIANIYAKETNYRLVKESSNTGYGDLLRKTFPKVLMIELSKMGGNPIAPYGDKENIEKCFNENYNAINSTLEYLNYQLENQNIKR